MRQMCNFSASVLFTLGISYVKMIVQESLGVVETFYPTSLFCHCDILVNGVCMYIDPIKLEAHLFLLSVQ